MSVRLYSVLHCSSQELKMDMVHLHLQSLVPNYHQEYNIFYGI